jgi:hypothetical protein
MEAILFASANLETFFTIGVTKLSFCSVKRSKDSGTKTNDIYKEITLTRHPRPKNIFNSLRQAIQQNKEFFWSIQSVDCILVDSRELYFLYRRCLPYTIEVQLVQRMFSTDEELAYLEIPKEELLKSHTINVASKLAEKAFDRPWSFIVQALNCRPSKRTLEESGAEQLRTYGCRCVMHRKRPRLESGSSDSEEDDEDDDHDEDTKKN